MAPTLVTSAHLRRLEDAIGGHLQLLGVVLFPLILGDYNFGIPFIVTKKPFLVNDYWYQVPSPPPMGD